MVVVIFGAGSRKMDERNKIRKEGKRKKKGKEPLGLKSVETCSSSTRKKNGVWKET